MTEQVLPFDGQQFGGSRFGDALIIEGDIALVGSPGQPNELSGVYRYRWENERWVFNDLLEPYEEDIRGGQAFGAALFCTAFKLASWMVDFSVLVAPRLRK